MTIDGEAIASPTSEPQCNVWMMMLTMKMTMMTMMLTKPHTRGTRRARHCLHRIIKIPQTWIISNCVKLMVSRMVVPFFCQTHWTWCSGWWFLFFLSDTLDMPNAHAFNVTPMPTLLNRCGEQSPQCRPTRLSSWNPCQLRKP